MASSRAAFGDLDRGGKRATADGGQVDRNDRVAPHTHRLCHSRGRFQLEAMPLSVVDRNRIQIEPFVEGDRGDGGRIEPAG